MLDCFESSKVTLLLCLSKAESSPVLQKLTRTLTTLEDVEDVAMMFLALDADQRNAGTRFEIVSSTPQNTDGYGSKKESASFYSPFGHRLKVQECFSYRFSKSR